MILNDVLLPVNGDFKVERLKICFVTLEYPPSIFGGAGVYAKYLTKELVMLGHEVHVISPSSNQKAGNFRENGIFVHRIPFLDMPFLRLASHWLSLIKYYRTLSYTVGGFDILHANTISDLSLLEHLVNIPRIVTVHHLARSVLAAARASIRSLRELGVTPLIEKTVFTRADRIIAISRFTKHSLASIYDIPTSKVRVIYNGVSLQKNECCKPDIQEISDQLGITGDFVFLFVGRPDVRKGLQVLMKAFRNVIKWNRNVKLIIVGQGQWNEFKKIAENYGIFKHIIFMGWVDDVTLRKLYSLCDIFVLPSLLEGFGLTLLEAMAMGKPVVTTKVGGIPEFVRDPENGILVTPNDIKELTDALKFFIENHNLAKEIGKYNKSYVKNFSWTKTAKATEQVYREVIAREPLLTY